MTIKYGPRLPPFNIDADPRNADWLKFFHQDADPIEVRRRLLAQGMSEKDIQALPFFQPKIGKEKE